MAAAVRRVQKALLRPTERLARDANTGKAMEHALHLVKDVLAKNLTPEGLTTAEIFKLSQEHKPPPDFKPAHLPKNSTIPPKPDSVIRSPHYLKKWILPLLRADGFIRMAPVQRGPKEEIWAWVPDPLAERWTDRIGKTKPHRRRGQFRRVEEARKRYRELREAMRMQDELVEKPLVENPLKEDR